MMQKTWRLASYIEQDGTSDCAESEAGTRLSLESQHSDFLAPPPRVSHAESLAERPKG